MINSGKKFEEIFKQDWKSAFPNTFIFRINDQITGYKITSQNPCDYLCFPKDKLFMVECKSHDGSSIPFTAMPQYERLLAYKDMPNVCAGFVIWFKEKDVVIWADISVVDQIYKDGNKSIQLKMLEKSSYNLLVLPSEKKRVYLSTDYSKLLEYYE